MSIARQKNSPVQPSPTEIPRDERRTPPTLHRAAGFLRQTCLKRPVWFRLALASTVLVGEIAFFTLLFEFNTGPMRLVANSIVLTGVIVGAIGFAMVASQRRSPVELAHVDETRSRAWIWAGIHFVVLLGFFFLTRRVQAGAGGATTGWGISFVWVAMAMIVGGSLWMSAFAPKQTFAYLRQSVGALIGAAIVAALMILLTPGARELWLVANGPALEIIRHLLEWFPGYASITFRGLDRPIPMVGTSNIPLVVTQHCSEMEAMLAYLLLGILLVVAGGRRMWSFYFLAPFLVGFEILYVLNALRLYLLLLMGHVMVDTTWAPYAGRACVSLAHSRVGNFVLLTIGVLILLVGDRLSRREWVSMPVAKSPA